MTTALSTPPAPVAASSYAVSTGPEAERRTRVEDELHGLCAVDQLDHAGDGDERQQQPGLRRDTDAVSGRRGDRRGHRLPRASGRGSSAISAAEIANVTAVGDERDPLRPDASRIAPIAGPITTPRSCTVCSSAFAAPSRALPHQPRQQRDRGGPLGRPAADASAVNAITISTGPFRATTTREREHHREPQAGRRQISTVRRE